MSASTVHRRKRAATRASRDPLAVDWSAKRSPFMPNDTDDSAAIRAGYAQAGIYLMVRCRHCGVPESNYCIGLSGGRVTWHMDRRADAQTLYRAFRVVADGVPE